MHILGAAYLSRKRLRTRCSPLGHSESICCIYAEKLMVRHSTAITQKAGFSSSMLRFVLLLLHAWKCRPKKIAQCWTTSLVIKGTIIPRFPHTAELVAFSVSSDQSSLNTRLFLAVSQSFHTDTIRRYSLTTFPYKLLLLNQFHWRKAMQDKRNRKQGWVSCDVIPIQVLGSCGPSVLLTP